mmetsp:Transcript_13435/g.16300  ORF Transcript_13435/g.16300 Transcript_13435/m.16300 type:complete len:828 (+) Transcript_13435:488-2971(+)
MERHLFMNSSTNIKNDYNHECFCSCRINNNISLSIIIFGVFVFGLIIGSASSTASSTTPSSTTATLLKKRSKRYLLKLGHFLNRFIKKYICDNDVAGNDGDDDNDNAQQDRDLFLSSNKDEEAYIVLKESLMLVMKQFFEYDTHESHSCDVDNYNVHKWKRKEYKSNGDSKVVQYLSPDEMRNTLFFKDEVSSPSMSLNNDLSTDPYHSNHPSGDNHSNNKSKGKNNDINQTTNPSKSSQMIHLFQQIQKYSVNTSHPLFFNQLFGSLDPIALAAELIALSVNTSAYTWETAPVFTLIEKEVMTKLCRLVFERDDDDNDDHGRINQGRHSNNDCNSQDDEKYDGLMLPGGSLSNLTAIHVARHFTHYGTQHLSKVENTKVLLGQKEEEEFQQVKEEVWKNNIEEEKKEQFHDFNNKFSTNMMMTNGSNSNSNNNSNSNSNSNRSNNKTNKNKSLSSTALVAFVSSEAHYSFAKAASVTGIGAHNLISVPTLEDGQMDVNQLDMLMWELYNAYNMDVDDRCDSVKRKIPFFVATTAGSTVRGSFDNIDAIVQVCRKHEEIWNERFIHECRIVSSTNHDKDERQRRCKIWVHVDGAWGGSAIFSSRADMKSAMKGIQNVDSFTFNPHKLLGAPQQTTSFVSRHKGILKAANSSGAKYLFDCRKNGAECDLGDSSYTCGRRTDAVKLWALWKYYGPTGIGQMLERKVDSLSLFAQMIRNHDSFMLACKPWLFNVNFFYLPERIRQKLKDSGVDLQSDNPVLSDDISKELATVSVKLKLKLHQSGEMLIPYQPLSNQKADGFRLVLAGYKNFDESDFRKVLQLMEKYGKTL